MDNGAVATFNFVDTSMPHGGVDNIADSDGIVIDGQEPPKPITDLPPTPPQPNQPNQPPSADNNTEGGETPKQAYMEWAQGMGLTIDPTTVKDDLTETEMRVMVGKNYALDYAKQVDPFMEFLLDKGISLDAWQNEIQPLQNIVEADAVNLYTYKAWEIEIEEQTSLQQIDPNDQAALDALWDKIYGETTEKMKDLAPEQQEALVAKYREDKKSELSKMTDGWKDVQLERNKAQQDSLIEKNNNEVNQFVGKLDELLKTAPKTLGQPDKMEMEQFIKEQLMFTDIKVKTADGEQTVKGIPFIHKMNTDEGFKFKVMTLLHALETGRITDIANSAAQNTLGKFRAMPLVKGSVTQPLSNLDVVDTSKPH
jgi:hypothetical protein